MNEWWENEFKREETNHGNVVTRTAVSKTLQTIAQGTERLRGGKHTRRMRFSQSKIQVYVRPINRLLNASKTLKK